MQKILIHIVLLGMLSACSIYRADVEQGNLVSAEQVAKLSIGMDKRTVQGVLGTPLVRDAFRHDRWDYYYSLRQDGKLVKRTLLTLRFDNDRLAKIEGLPAAK
jgi:outer membrane protein assembly factor BamE